MVAALIKKRESGISERRKEKSVIEEKITEEERSLGNNLELCTGSKHPGEDRDCSKGGAVSVKPEERLEDKGVRARADPMFMINS